MHRFAAIAAALLLSACQSDDPFTQIGYFKDAASNRVFILHADTATPEQAQAAAERLSTSASRAMIAYLFTGPAKPTDAVTLAGSYMAANTAMFEQSTPWRWRYVVSPDGATTLVDCATPTDRGNCR